MADEAASSSNAPSEDLSVNISIVSPSTSVNAPLNFPSLPPSTTVAQIKQKVRDALDSKPSNEQQRLIHQGKLLSREEQTLLEVFGEQKLRDSNNLIVHLVIREIPSVDHHASPSQTAAPRGQSPARNPMPNPGNPFAAIPQASPHNHPHGHHGHQPTRFGRPVVMPGQPHSPFPGPGFGMPAPPGGPMPAQLVAQQQQLLQNYMNHFNQRPGGTPPQQSHQAGSSPFPPGTNTQGRNSPHPENQPQPFVQQGIGPNGEFYRVTMNSAIIGPNGPIPVPVNLPQGNDGSPAPGGPFSTNDVHNILRTADASEQASSIMANAMHRSASGASLPNLALGNHRQPIQPPGVTVPRRPGSTVPLSRTATPDATRTPSYGSNVATQGQPSRSPTPTPPEVYILNSPQGPRALLINSPSDLYYTPTARMPAPTVVPPGFASPWLQPHPPPRASSGPAVGAGQPHAQPQAAATPAQQRAPQQGNIRVGLYRRPAIQQQARLQPLGPGAAPMHPANPEGGLAGALLAALWPHIWLLIRLSLFVWWFTSADTSWTRWLTVLTIAITIFIVNTGFFNRMANDMFNPLRQHLEGLIPFGALEDNRNRRDNAPGANAQPGQEGENVAAAQAGRRRAEPDPAQTAARLVEQRRNENGHWLLDQIRRLERAGLLFLASIAPGVAERHIANMEAAERAERERQEAAERTERERREEQERAASEAGTAAANVAAESVEGEGATQDTPTGEASASASGATEQQHQPAVAIP
ncbi:hypothetical protein N0V93_006953 [Gnomoniopsis smithogilvyi]|uniref:Ubiquitin-like domain-containing protein n=1 Tax=Gnomoniopsis smithogilvyi TaxID=1191159 RepID=A0A9W8YQT8_9PEZI|nr:hypothetical protein N0V93_006953 [Gnomoniopsis smithogilvyi]